MTEYLQVDKEEYDTLLAIQERLDSSIQGCETYFAPDSHMDLVNSGTLEILKYVKVGKQHD